MSPAERFVKLAAECERMAKFTHTRESRIEWARFAQRWRRYAEIYDRQESAAHHGSLTRRHRAAPKTGSH
jgi:hypothetical protein